MNNDTLARAKKEYAKAPADVRQFLERIFGKESFKSNWKDINSFEDACAANGTFPEDVLPYSTPTTSKQEAMNGVAMMWEIFEAINQGWEADYSNSSQYKWYPWFKYDPSISGFRFYGSHCAYVRTYSACGSRLCCETEEQSNHIGKQFIDIWNKILTK